MTLASHPATRTPPGGLTGPLLVVPADFGVFAGRLTYWNADPRLSAAQTFFTTQDVAGDGIATPWPPMPRDACWCGARRKYQKCCGPRAR